MTTGSRSSKPSSRCFASENSDWKIVADASAALISAIRASVPSSNPRYAPIGPSTRCTMRAPRRAKRRSRRKSKLNELKRHTGVPPEIVPTSTSSPRLSSSRTSARRNWCPPPAGDGANSWKSARSARPPRVARVRPRCGQRRPMACAVRRAGARDVLRMHGRTLTARVAAPGTPACAPAAAAASTSLQSRST